MVPQIGGPQRIIIEVDLVKGTSVLKTQGVLTIPNVLDILLTQFTQLFQTFIKQTLGIIDTSGKVIVKQTEGDETLAEPKPNGTAEEGGTQ